MSHLGDFAPASSVVFNFNTASFSDGSPITLAGTPALSVYKNSTTESTTGVTLTVDYDARTGMHHVVIDTSADGTFYAAGNDFSVVITTGTVGGTSVVGRVVGAFSLNNRSALRPTTAGRTLDVSATGEAGVDWANIGSPSTTVNLSATVISTSQTVASAASVSTIGSGAITSTSFAAGAIDSAAIATDAIGSNELAASAITEIAGGVWDLATTGHTTSGTFGAAMAAAGAAGDPWSTSLPAAYGAGTAGFIVGTNLDALISSRTKPSDTQAAVTVVTTTTNLTNAPTAGDLTATMKASVKSQLTDVLATDTYAEPATVPAATSTLKDKLGWMFALLRNKRTQTATLETLRNDGDSASIGTSTKGDDGTTLTRGKWA